MKKIILIIFIIFFIPVNSFAAGALSDNITAVENSIFGYDYLNDTDTVRLERIEKYLYGDKKTGNIQKRLENIQNDIGYVNPQPNTIPNAKPKNNNDIRNNMSSVLNNELMGMQEDESVDYPIVDAMEQEVFKTTYKKESIYKRLDRLEEHVFNRKTNDDLNTRVERLAMSISPVKNKKRMDSYTAEELNSYYSNSGLANINDQTVPFQLTVLEQDLLRGNYDNDNVSNRLSRLEQKLFKRTFTTDSDISRLQRIMVAYDAKKNSYKYENNRKMQNMATASQIGGILLMILAILL